MSEAYFLPTRVRVCDLAAAMGVGTSARIGPDRHAWLVWEPATSDHLETLAPPKVPSLRDMIERVCAEAKLTAGDFAAILGRDRRNVASWKSGAQQPRPEIVRMIDHLQALIGRLQKRHPEYAASVLSPLYGHPYRGRIIELVRSGDLLNAERLAVTSAADLDLQGREVMAMSPSDYAAGVAERRSAPDAMLSSSESLETDEDRARMRRLLRSRRVQSPSAEQSVT
jgi:DNA-binding transcriptional regulator YiaG